MKPILFSLLFLFITKIGFSQVTKKNELIINPTDRLVYLDSTDLETKSKNYKYIRVIRDYALDKNDYIIQEYYRSGQLRMQRVSKTYNSYAKEGEVTYYYKNGAKKSLTNYIKGRVNGKDFEWHENGTKKLEGEYVEDEKKHTSQHKISQFWDENGVQQVVDGNGFYDDKSENKTSKGELKNGFKEGVWEDTFNKVRYVETYKGGKFISGECFDGNNVSNKYTELEVKPMPKGGMTEFYKFIAKNYRSPNVKGLNGKVYLTFIIDTDGKVVEPRVLRDVGYGTGIEALRVLSICKNWIPGEQRGRKVRCTYSLPITINSTQQEHPYKSPFGNSNGF